MGDRKQPTPPPTDQIKPPPPPAPPKPFVRIGDQMEPLDESRLTHKIAEKWYRAADAIGFINAISSAPRELCTCCEPPMFKSAHEPVGATTQALIEFLEQQAARYREPLSPFQNDNYVAMFVAAADALRSLPPPLTQDFPASKQRDITTQEDWMYHEMTCASRQFGSERGLCSCGLTRQTEAPAVTINECSPPPLGELRSEVGIVLRQVELTTHRADALPPATYAEKPTAADWRERVTWLSAVLRKAMDRLEDEHLAHLRAEAEVARLTHQLEEARKDVVYHHDCRPNRREAEAAIADAKAMNDKWADEVKARREAEAVVARLTQARDTLQADHDAMLDAFFAQLAAGWDIEPREVFEREAPTNGFKWAICQALHHTWKRAQSGR